MCLLLVTGPFHMFLQLLLLHLSLLVLFICWLMDMDFGQGRPSTILVFLHAQLLNLFEILLNFIYLHLYIFYSSVLLFLAGKNAILLYAGHTIAYRMFPWHWSYGPMNTHFFLTVEAIWGTFLWILISYWLHKKEFYLSLWISVIGRTLYESGLVYILLCLNSLPT